MREEPNVNKNCAVHTDAAALAPRGSKRSPLLATHVLAGAVRLPRGVRLDSLRARLVHKQRLDAGRLAALLNLRGGHSRQQAVQKLIEARPDILKRADSQPRHTPRP